MTEAPAARRPRLIAAIAATSALAIIAIALAFSLGWTKADTPTTANSSPSPSPSPKGLGEEATCVLLLPTLKDVQVQVQAIVDKPDGTTVDFARVGTLIKDLETIRQVAPADMSTDINAQAAPLTALIEASRGGKSTIPLEEFRASGFRLVGRCAPYAK